MSDVEYDLELYRVSTIHNPKPVEYGTINDSGPYLREPNGLLVGNLGLLLFRPIINLPPHSTVPIPRLCILSEETTRI